MLSFITWLSGSLMSFSTIEFLFLPLLLVNTTEEILWDYATILLLLKLFFIYWWILQPLSPWNMVIGYFVSLIPPTFIHRNSSVRNTIPPSLFVCSLVYNSLGSWCFFYFMGFGLILLLFILLLKLFQLWPLGALSGWLLCPPDTPHHRVFWALLTSCHHKMLHAHLAFPHFQT